jgi:hypothetical protein
VKTYEEVLALIDSMGLKDREAVEWLDKYIPNWLETHDTKITYAEGIQKQ